jgi:hypothetical protein
MNEGGVEGENFAEWWWGRWGRVREYFCILVICYLGTSKVDMSKRSLLGKQISDRKNGYRYYSFGFVTFY